MLESLKQAIRNPTFLVVVAALAAVSLSLPFVLARYLDPIDPRLKWLSTLLILGIVPASKRFVYIPINPLPSRLWMFVAAVWASLSAGLPMGRALENAANIIPGGGGKFLRGLSRLVSEVDPLGAIKNVAGRVGNQDVRSTLTRMSGFVMTAGEASDVFFLEMQEIIQVTLAKAQENLNRVMTAFSIIMTMLGVLPVALNSMTLVNAAGGGGMNLATSIGVMMITIVMSVLFAIFFVASEKLYDFEFDESSTVFAKVVITIVLALLWLLFVPPIIGRYLTFPPNHPILYLMGKNAPQKLAMAVAFGALAHRRAITRIEKKMEARLFETADIVQTIAIGAKMGRTIKATVLELPDGEVSSRVKAVAAAGFSGVDILESLRVISERTKSGAILNLVMELIRMGIDPNRAMGAISEIVSQLRSSWRNEYELRNSRAKMGLFTGVAVASVFAMLSYIMQIVAAASAQQQALPGEDIMAMTLSMLQFTMIVELISMGFAIGAGRTGNFTSGLKEIGTLAAIGYIAMILMEILIGL